MKIARLPFLFLVALTFISCVDEDEKPPFYTSKGAYDSGVLVLNSGSDDSQNASISFISFDLNTTINNVFGLENGITLGERANDIGFYEDLAYVVVYGSNKIEIVNRYTLKKIKTITTGLLKPRHIEFYNGKGYVTCWSDESISTDDYVAVINLNTNEVIKNISVVEGPENLIQFNGKIYVSHTGVLSQNNKVTIINTTTDLVDGSPITVGDVPSKLAVYNEDLWIFCAGNPNSAVVGETPAKIVKMNLTTNVVSTFKTFSASTNYPTMIIYGSYIYYTYNNVVFKEILEQTNPATTIKNFNPSIDLLYSLEVKNNYVYVGGFNTSGTVKIFANGERTETDGSGNLIYPFGKLLKTTTVGIGPRGFYFNQ